MSRSTPLLPPGAAPFGTAGDVSDGRLHPAEARLLDALRAHDPRLADVVAGLLPRSRSITLRRLVEALWREDVAGFRSHGRLIEIFCGTLGRIRPGTWAVSELPGGNAVAFPVLAEHAFGRIDAGSPVLHVTGTRGATALTHPTDLVSVLSTSDDLAWDGLSTELADGAANLALALARADQVGRTARRAAARTGATDCVDLAYLSVHGGPSAEPTVFLEKLATGGHNLHPCGRTRLGMDPDSLLRHDVEANQPTVLTLVAVRRDQTESTPDSSGRDVGEVLLAAYPRLAAAVEASGLDRRKHLFLPVHPWQLDHVVCRTYADQISRGEVVPVRDACLAAEPTISVRTLLTEAAPDGRRFFVKTALDVQITSTRRSISAHTATNGPVFSALLDRIAAAEPQLPIVVLPELAGASYRGERSLTALVRADLTGRLRPGEQAVPGCALYARSPLSGRGVLAELVERHAVHRGEPRADLAALSFVDCYARVLLGAVLPLMTRYGIGLEAHLQNSLVTFVDGVPTRVVFRDWGGLRAHLPRLARSGYAAELRPGSVTVTSSVDVLRAKVAYTALQSHLGEIVVQLGRSHGLAETAAWARVRDVVVDVFADLATRADRAGDRELADDVVADARALLGPVLPHKALVSMRLRPDSGDQYVPVPNPLWNGEVA